jgi:DNA-binding LacI/PurR family transcriptional regulator/DNA-binding transcriptional regulator YhcF (GntR family)
LIDKSSPIPLYSQLKATLEQDIDQGRLQPGDRMPSEFELAHNFKVSRTTARQALQQLCEAGLVLRIQGKGTFVRDLSQDPSPSAKNKNGNGASTEAGAAAAAPRLRPPQAVRLVSFRDGEDIGFDRSFQNLVQGVEREARERGYDLILSSCLDTRDDLDLLLERRAESGLILIGEFRHGFAAELARRGIPAVVVDDPVARGESVDGVFVDHKLAARQATQMLIDEGHQVLAYMGGARFCDGGSVTEWNTSMLRCEGFREALKDAGLSLSEDHVLVEYATQRHGCLAARRILDRIHKPTAFVAFSPSLALGVLAAADEKGLNVPDDLSLVTFSDVERVCFKGERSFSAVWNNAHTMGRQAVQLLSDRLDQPSRPPKAVAVPIETWAGDTCAKPAVSGRRKSQKQAAD